MLYKGYAAGDKEGALVVPYADIRERPSRFIARKYVPDGITLVDPSDLQEAEVHALLNHWVSRVEQGKIAFRFHRIKLGDSRYGENNGARKVLAAEEGLIDPVEVFGEYNSVSDTPWHFCARLTFQRRQLICFRLV